MRRIAIASLPTVALVVGTLATSDVEAQSSGTYPPIARYLMERNAEIALARSAAPANISERATIKVLTTSGFEVAERGTNANVCLVMRGFSAPMYTAAQERDNVYDPTISAPICFTELAARTVMPYYELRTKLALSGKHPDQIAEGVQTAYSKGQLPRRDGVAFAYMYSAHQKLSRTVGAWRPHLMIFAPYYDNAMLGNNRSGLNLQVVDDAGTPFTVLVVAVDSTLAIRLRSEAQPAPRQ